MLKYTMENHKVMIDPVSITLEPLRNIWTSDKSKIKDKATILLTYIHVASQIDQDAPFSKADPKEVTSLVKKELFGDYEYDFVAPFDNEYMENAIIQYQLAYETPEEAMVRTYNKKIHEIRLKIDTTEIEISKTSIKGSITYSSNFTILNKMMQDLGKIIKARDELLASITKQTAKGDVKGQKQISFLQKRQREMAKTTTTVASEEEDDEKF